MYWRETPASAGGDIDPEHELELRLAAQAQAGAAWALSALVARYQPPVVRYLVRLTGNTELAHALAEQVFVRMGKRLRGPQGGQHLRLWLLRAATEVGLDALRRPGRTMPRRLEGPPRPVGLLGEGSAGESRVGRLLSAWGARVRAAESREATPPTQEFVWQSMAGNAETGAEQEQVSPQEAIRRRLMRAVLAELPYGDAQCLALHLVAGLNQSEVASALGVAAPIARRRIVQGLQLFGRRYDAALASLGLQAEQTAEEPAERTELAPFVPAEPQPFSGLPTPTPDVAGSTAPLGALALSGPTAPLSAPDLSGPTHRLGEPPVVEATLARAEPEPSGPTAPLSALEANRAAAAPSDPDLSGPTARLGGPDLSGPTAPLGQTEPTMPPAPQSAFELGGPTAPLAELDLGEPTAPLSEPDLSGPTARLSEDDLSGPTAPLDRPEVTVDAGTSLDVFQAAEVVVESGVSGEPDVEAASFVEAEVSEATTAAPNYGEVIAGAPPVADLVASVPLEAAYAGEETPAIGAPAPLEPPAEPEPFLPVGEAAAEPAPARLVPVLARRAERALPAPEPPSAASPVADGERPADAAMEASMQAAAQPVEVAAEATEPGEADSVEAAAVVPVWAQADVEADEEATESGIAARADQVPAVTERLEPPAVPESPRVVPVLAHTPIPAAMPELPVAPEPRTVRAVPVLATAPAWAVNVPAAAGQEDDVVLVVEADPLVWDDAQEHARRSRMVRVLSADGEAEDPGDDETPGAVSGLSS